MTSLIVSDYVNGTTRARLFADYCADLGIPCTVREKRYCDGSLCRLEAFVDYDFEHELTIDMVAAMWRNRGMDGERCVTLPAGR